MSKRRRLPTGLFWREGKLYARIQVAGREFKRCLFTDDVAVARSRLAGERERLTAELRFGEHDRRWEDVVASWGEHIVTVVGPRTAKRYAQSLKALYPLLAGRRLGEITKAFVGDAVAWRRKQGASPATVRRDLTALSSVLTYAEARDWHEGNAALTWSRLTKERRDPIVLPDAADVAWLIEKAGPLAAITAIALGTGIRQDELVRANRSDMDTERKALTLRIKGNRTRTVDVSNCWDLFKALPASVGRAALIPCPGTGKRWKNVSSRFSGLTARLKKRAEKEDRAFRRFRFHDLRHLFAVLYLREGRGSIYDLQQHMNHSSVKVTELYLDFLTPEEAYRAKHGKKPSRKPEHGIEETEIPKQFQDITG